MSKQMKRLSVALLLLGLAGCKYPSMFQAEEACREWRSAETVTRVYRSCRPEEATNQVLGVESMVDGTGNVTSLELVKNFRY